MKKMRREYSVLWIFSIAFFVTLIGYSQTTQQENIVKELKDAAKETAAMWSRELSLSSKQTSLMEEKIFAFSQKKNQVIYSKRREEAKKERLQTLQQEEFQQVKHILSEPQFEEYLDITRKRIHNQAQFEANQRK